jgi:Lar family restriction alleviation protein
MATPDTHVRLGLLQCPFCGARGEDLEYRHVPYMAGSFGVVQAACACGARGPAEDTLGNAAKAWNEVAVVVLAWNGCDVPAELLEAE